MKVKEFNSRVESAEKLEEQINKWLKENDSEIEYILAVSYSANNFGSHCLITYSERDL